MVKNNKKNSINRRPKYVTRAAVRDMLRSVQEPKAYAANNAIGIALAPAGIGYRVSGGIILGDNSFQRDGAQVQLTKLDVRFTLNGSIASNTNARVIIVQDKQANSADMTITQLLNSADHYSPWHPAIQAEQKRFHIVADKTFDLSFNGTNSVTWVQSFRPLKTVQYLDVTDNSVACGRNFLWIWVLGNNTSANYVLSTEQHFTDS